MPWVNLDDKMPQHPKVLRLSDTAFRLHISGICYCSEYLTDGVLPAEVVTSLVPRFKRSALAELTERDVWLSRAGSYHIRDYLQWNRSRKDVAEERERKSAAGRKGAKNRWHLP